MSLGLSLTYTAQRPVWDLFENIHETGKSPSSSCLFSEIFPMFSLPPGLHLLVLWPERSDSFKILAVHTIVLPCSPMTACSGQIRERNEKKKKKIFVPLYHIISPNFDILSICTYFLILLTFQKGEMNSVNYFG